jgi:hypothetical protein
MGVRALVFGLLTLTTAACTATNREARSVGARVLDCPLKETEIDDLGNLDYAVKGCGRRVDVSCRDPKLAGAPKSSDQEGSSCRASSWARASP